MTNVHNNDDGSAYNDGDDDNSRRLHVCCVWQCCMAMKAWAAARARGAAHEGRAARACRAGSCCCVGRTGARVLSVGNGGDVGEVEDVMGWL